MHYDVTVIENPANKGITRLPLHIIYCILLRYINRWHAVGYYDVIQMEVVVCKKLWLKRLQ